MDATGVISRTTGEELHAKSEDLCIGHLFRQARLRAGLDLQQVCADLKISVSYLQAIEEMDQEALPHRVYALGFVRCYAEYLGFNAKTSIENFKAGACSTTTTHRDISSKPVPFWFEYHVPRGFGLAVAVIGILGLITWFGQRTSTIDYTVPPVPELLGTWSQDADLHNIPAIAIKPALQAQIDASGS